MQVIRLLPVVFLCAGAVVAVDQFLQDRLLGLRDARNIIIASVGQSRARLVNGLWQAASDSIIQQGVADRNINSLSQTLQNYLRPGEVSQIEILDSECNLLVRVSGSKKPLPSGCRPGDGARFGLKWQQGSDEIPTLSMALPKTMGGLSVVFLAHLALDQAWLSAHPELFNLLASNKYSLYETSPHGVVWRDGVSSQGQALIELRVAGWIGRFLPDFTRYSLNFPSTPLWWIFSMVGAIIALSIGQARMAEKRDRVHRRRFLAWAARYPELGHQSDADKMSPEEGWDKVSLAIEAKMDRLLEQRQLKWNMMRERQDQLILGAVQRDRQIGELQERLAAMSDLASLKEQLQHSTGSFLKKMEDVRELCENMFDLASEGLAKQSKELHELAMRWKNGIDDQNHRERGARKFLRSLSETASTRPGLTKLDDELDSLSALTGSAMDQSLHLAMLSRQALCELESGVQVAGLWLGLSMRENERERTCDWMECLLAAQKLVGAEARYSTLSFETLPRLASPEDTYPPVARVALVSGLFHLYMALLTEESLESIKSPILLRQKRLSDQGTMIFSLPHRANDVSEGDLGRGQAYHMELAKAILAPLKIRAAFLPPNFAGVPVALSWQLPVKSVDVTPERDVTHSVLGADC